MTYRKFQDLQLSALGFGAMRLPVIDGDDARVDQDAVNEMVDLAMARGVNYYDTAWGYHGGNSEPAMGRALARHPREKFYLATKFPGYDLGNMGKVEEIFEAQLQRCGVEYFDFYLFHNVCEMNIEAYLDDARYGTYAYLTRQKKNGRIRHLGFSTHGSLELMERFLNAYGKDMEFCQIQLNWPDWDFQLAKEKVALLKKWNIPIWVMEPLRGGRLAKLDAADVDALHALRPDEGVPAWSFRYLQRIPEVTVTLSGMSNMEQLRSNLDTFDADKPLDARELAALEAIARKILGSNALPCTACRYCVSHCPQGLNIPDLLQLYNEHCITGGGFITPMALSALPEDKWPSACVGCQSCEAVCPQQLPIAKTMAAFAEAYRR